jgi:hypothetical protein
MAFEVACSQCEGRLMVEEAGVVVACPHCGAHLNIEAPTESEVVETGEPNDTPDNAPATELPEQPEATIEQPVAAASEPEPSSDHTAEVVEPEAATTAALVGDEPEPGDAVSTMAEAPISVPATETVSVGDAPAPLFVANLEPVQEPAAESTDLATLTGLQAAAGAVEAPSIVSVPAGHGVSLHTFTLVRNYAIAMTLAVIFLIYRLLNPNMSALESLPDVKPPKKDDKIVYKLVPEATEMPPGHRLSLGQSQRFGNLKVTPVRVTKEPVEFVHHLGHEGVPKESGPEVVKLWFEFENLSTDQSIAPLDGLVFKRDDNDFDNVRSNNFACRLSQKKKGGKLAFVYDLNEFDIWNLRDQNVDVEIAPGGKVETYIPTTEEGVAQLINSDEPLIWRVHFRKGYSPRNYGVTTVIEVAFESSDIGAASVTQPADEPASAPNA